jgi:lipopolysaccharide biosynthesis glycosyltransferase
MALAQDIDPMHIVCAADANYGPYAGITIASVLTANVGDAVHIHLFSDGIVDRDIKRIAGMARRFGAQFTVYDIKTSLDRISNLPKRINHYTRTTYGRLFLPEILSVKIARAIYLDCDIICVSSLRELWTMGEDIPLLGAVRDSWVDSDTAHKRALGIIPEDRPYFNGGMLLVNTEAWRRRNIGDRLRHLLSEPTPMKHADQDVINGALWQEITELPRRWNLLITSPRPEEIPKQLMTAANIHFCGGFKPWHIGYKMMGGPAGEMFQRVKAASPWRWMLPDFQLRRLKRKLLQAMARDHVSKAWTILF